ncbi:MAG: restriction endonuclease subunit S [Gemmatimonadota bacterium]
MKTVSEARTTPRLRFPEFSSAGGWTIAPLVEVAAFVTDRVSVSEIAARDYVSTENLLPNFGGMADGAKLPPTSSVTRYQRGDVLVSNIRPYLRKVWLADRDGGASNDVIVFRAVDPELRTYLSLLLKSDSFIDYVMRGARGLKMPRGDLGSIRQYPVAYPGALERRKITDCLTSLSALIAAQARKVEALKAHKWGLTQQLFPREGEMVPRLRFSEFRRAPEWKEIKAGKLFANRAERGDIALPIYSVTMHDGMVRRSAFGRDFGDIEEPAGNRKARKGDIAYNMMRMWQGALGIAVEDCLVSPAYVVLAPGDGVVSQFFAYLFKLPTSLRLLTSHSRGLTKDRLRLYYDDFATITLYCPTPAEQQRIADCLSSIDADIATEFTRLDALESHRAALMQQLFPSPEVA